MRRGIKPDLVSCFGQQCKQGYSDRTLAVCSCNMNKLQVFFGTVELLQKHPHALESQLDLEELEVIQKCPCFLVVHLLLVSWQLAVGSWQLAALSFQYLVLS